MLIEAFKNSEFNLNSPQGDTRNLRLKIRNENIVFDTNKCDFCQKLNEMGNLGTVTTGQDCFENLENKPLKFTYSIHKNQVKIFKFK